MTLEPRIERHTITGKAPDKSQKGELRKIKRELRREHRGAVRELRKDSAFVTAERRRRSEGEKASKTDERRKNHAWLQTQAQRGWQ